MQPVETLGVSAVAQGRGRMSESVWICAARRTASAEPTLSPNVSSVAKPRGV